MSQPPVDPQRPASGNHPVTYAELQRLVFLVFGILAVWRMAAELTAVLLFFLTVFILSAVINPAAVFLQRYRVPRLLSALGVALLLILAVATVIQLAFPPLLKEVTAFTARLPEKQELLEQRYQEWIARYPEIARQLPSPDEIMRQLSPRLAPLATGVLGTMGRFTVNAAVGVFSILFLLVLVVYTVAHPVPLLAGLLAATPERYRPRMESALRRILEQLKNWALGSVVLGIIVGMMTCAGLWTLGKVTGTEGGFPYILLFSVIAGVGEMIPSIGPVISAIPPILVALTIDPVLALWVLVLFVLIQQLENNLIVPVVMGQSLNLHPVSIIFAVLVMGTLFGLLGAILAVPVSAIVKVCWEEFYLVPRGLVGPELEELAARIVTEGSPDPRDKPRKPRVTGGAGRVVRFVRKRKVGAADEAR